MPPQTMKVVEARSFSKDDLQLAEKPVPKLGPGEILIRIRAASLNYRDLAVLSGTYIANLPLPYVPASDAAGDVVEVAPGVTRFAVGDRVLPIYTQGWYDGKPTPEQRAKKTLGAPLSGVLQEYLAVAAEDAVLMPANLSYVEGATLPIAALTAWTTLEQGRVKAGDVVLIQGTGGVALFALQFAKLSGAKAIITSSSDEKLKHAKALGADVGINYKTKPSWEVAVRDATGGNGADIIVETGGATLAQSLRATAFGGFVGIVGFVAGTEATIPLRSLIGPLVRMEGIAVGSRRAFESMNKAILLHNVHPVVDSTFALENAGKAVAHMASGAHFGKVTLTVAE